MRGALRRHAHQSPVERIIPADAGSTIVDITDEYGLADHPRGCGEHVLPVMGLFASAGSSPRMRGAHIPLGGLHGCERIIPADAGSTISD